MPDTPTTSLEASLPRPVTAPAAQAALREMRITLADVADDLRLAAARLTEAECDLHCALRDDPLPGAGQAVTDLFVTLRQQIKASLPHSALRSDALLLLAEAQDKTGAAALAALAHDRHLQAIHHAGTCGPEGAA